MSRRRAAAVACSIACCALAAAAGQAGASVSVGNSGWFWGNPTPQGNGLLDVEFAGDRGYAVGESGTMLRSDDGGATWIGLRTGVTQALARVGVVDANTVIAGGGCMLLRSDDGGESFSRVPWTPRVNDCPSDLGSFHFPSPTVGFLATNDGSVFRTIDGGETFARRTSLPSLGAPSRFDKADDVFFLDATTGIATANGRVFRTVDAGDTWAVVSEGGGRALAFPTATDGYAVAGSTVFRTTDGGVTWILQPLTGAPSTTYLQSASVACANATSCLIANRRPTLLRTTDGGTTGTAITASTANLVSVAFVSATRAVAIGEAGAMVVSDDGGQTWAGLNAGLPPSRFRRLRASSDRIANLGTADGVLARTLDGGRSWTSVQVPTVATVVDASFPSQGSGYAIDSRSVFKTINGGADWKVLNPGVDAGLSAVLSIGPQDVLLTSSEGMRLSVDGGSSFQTVHDRDVRNVRLVNIDPAGAAILAYGGKALRVSGDSGRSWRTVELPSARTRLLDADFVSANVGFVLDRTSRLWQTRNGGRRWKELLGAGTEFATGISFSSATDGYLTADDLGGDRAGYAYRTDDGGKSFAPQLVSIGRLSELWDAGATAYAAMADGVFFATTTGGQSGAPSKLTVRQKPGSTRRSARSKRRIEIEGTLKPAQGGEQIVVSYHVNGDWRSRTEVADANGTFTSRFSVVATTPVVAQWLGDDTRAAAGSKLVRLKPPRRPQQ